MINTVNILETLTIKETLWYHDICFKLYLKRFGISSSGKLFCLAAKCKVPDEQCPPKKSSKKIKQVQDKHSANPEPCVTCDKEVEDNAIMCQWCSKWEHRVCAGISVNKYNMLSTSSNKIMFSVHYATLRLNLL